LATVVAGAGSNIVMNYMNIVNQNITNIVNQSITMVRETVFTSGRILGSITGRGAYGLTRAFGTTTHGVYTSITRVSREGFRIMYGIVKEIVSSPSGLFIAIMMYKTIDQFVPCSEEPYIKTIENIIGQINSFHVVLPVISIPSIDLSSLKNGVSVFFENIRNNIDKFISSLPEPSKPDISIECSQPSPPSNWYDVMGWIGYMIGWAGYGLCTAMSWIVNALTWIIYGFEWLGYYIVKGVLWIADKLVEII
jgi:hypothetical protein